MIRHIAIHVEPTPPSRRPRTFRFKAPAGSHFTEEGVEEVLEGFIGKFDDANPNHHYRLVPLANTGGTKNFKLVWEQADES